MMLKALRLLVLSLLLLAGAAQAAIALRAAASASLASAVGISPALVSRINNDAGASGAMALTINRPGSVLAGHVLVAQLALKGNAAAVGTITPPAGWTLVNQTSSGGAAPVTQAVYWKLATAAEPASYTWNWVNTVRAEGGIAAFSNVDVLDPVDSWGVRASNNTATITLPTLTFESTNVMLVAALVSSTTTTHTTPTGMNEQYDSNTGAGPNGVTASLATLAQVTTATSGARTASSGQAVDNIAHLLALRAAGAALTINVPAGTTAGDVMIASITMRPCSATNNAACTTTVTAPAGWTLVRQVQTRTGGGTDGYGSQLWIYQRVVTGAEPASYTWFFGGRPQQAGAAGGILTLSGVDTSVPIVAENGQATNAAVSHSTPGINTGTVANTMLVASFAASSSATWTPPTGMTERADRASRATPDDLGVSLEVATQLQAAAGAVAAKTATYTAPQPNADTGTTHVLALRPAPAAPHHYELSLASASVSCLATTVTVTACADASSPCTSTYAAASGATAALSTSAGALGAGTVTFNAAGVATTTLSHPTAADGAGVTITLSGESLSAANLRQCCADGTSCAVANSCSTTFKTAGFIFSDAADGALVTVPAQTAGTPALTAVPGPYYLRAVKTNTTTRACEAALAGTSAVTLGYQCNDPATCSSGNYLDIVPYNGGAAQPAQAVAPGGTGVNLYFDANGNAPLAFNYRDVGNITLTASKAAGGSLLTALSGTSNALVVKPGGFVLSDIKQTAAPQVANPAAADAAGGVFVKAGESFSATVTATTSGGATTPNFGRESTAEGVLLTSALVQPAGGNPGSLANATVQGSGVFTDGVATVSNLSWDEVGILSLTPSVADGNYLGAGDVTGTASGNIGRFIPHHFDVAVTQGCATGGYTYSGQPLSVTVTAMNGLATPARTQNYDGTGTAPQVYAMSVTFSEVNGVAGALAPASVAAGAFTAGQASATPAYSFTVKPSVPATVQLRAVDTDGASSDGFGEGTANIRSGRLRLANAYGSELLNLPVSLEAQHWTAGGFYTRNTDDSCTVIPMASLILANYTGQLNACEAQITPTGSQTLAAGRLAAPGLVLTRPGAGNSGSVELTLNTGAAAAGQTCVGAASSAATAGNLPWLAPNPTARATFGIYRSRLIYSRENY